MDFPLHIVLNKQSFFKGSACRNRGVKQDRNQGVSFAGINSKILPLQNSKGFKRQLKRDFTFDWEKEFNNEVYGLYLPHEKIIIGLMSVSNIQDEYRIHINLVESSITNRGKNKIIMNIPHCLISYACKLAFGFGYDGFVSLFPKTSLINYYINEYGFQQFGRHLAVFGDDSFKLIKQYVDEH